MHLKTTGITLTLCCLWAFDSADAQDCNRDCLIESTDNYLEALVAHDPVTGLVIGLSHFRHPMDSGPYEVTTIDGETEMCEMTFAPFDLPAAHVFKIGADGLVHEIEAMGFMAPYNSPTGWE